MQPGGAQDLHPGTAFCYATPVFPSECLLDIERLHEQRAPFDELEAAVIRLALAHPGELHDDAVDALRYVIRFAKLQVVQNCD